MKKRCQILRRERLYDGYFQIEKYRLKHSQFAGGMSGEIERELFERGHAAAVLPYDPQLGKVLLVEQFRIGAHVCGDDPWLLEPIAGILEPGESPEELVHREAMEEAGIELQQLRSICSYLVSPGGSSEKIWLFCAKADLSQAGGLHGLAEEGEDIKVHLFDVAEVLELLHGGQIGNAMALIALQWFELHHKNLFCT